MLPYWVLFLIPASAALVEHWPDPQRRGFALSFAALWMLLTIAVGFRYGVGADWYNYTVMYRYISMLSLEAALELSDPAYALLNWLAADWNLGPVYVNVICGALFALGLVVFARHQPRPWLASAVAVPYLVVVVGMGYSRQAVAIGCAMLGLASLSRGSRIGFAIWVALGGLFHKTAILLIPMAILARSRGRWWTAIWVGCLGVTLYLLLLADSVDALVENYIEQGYQSQGAAIRVAMNALPAALFLLYRKHFDLQGDERQLWTYMSLAALGFIVLLVISPSSTAVDRMALYFIPIQVFALSRLPDALQKRYAAGDLVRIGVLVYSATVMFVWLNFAVHARYWLPYRSYLLE